MAVSKAKKIEQVEELSQEMKQADDGHSGTFSKLTVAQRKSCAR